MTGNTDFSKSEQYTLSIRLSTDGFSFSIFNPLSADPPDIHHYDVDETLSLTANLKQAFRETEWLSNPFRHVNILASGGRFTFVPLEFFEDELAESFFHHNHPKRENEVVQYNILHNNNVVVLFGMDRSVCNFLREQHPDARFYAQASPLIEYCTAKSRLGNNRKMYVYLRKEALDVYAYERSRLLLANTFACKTSADRIYYLLYIWKQLGLDQERDELHLTGCRDIREDLLPELKRYIRQVFVMNPSDNLDLQAINLCE